MSKRIGSPSARNDATGPSCHQACMLSFGGAVMLFLALYVFRDAVVSPLCFFYVLLLGAGAAFAASA